MVDLSGNPESGGPIEHGFSNWVFIVPALITATLVGMHTWPAAALQLSFSLNCTIIIKCIKWNDMYSYRCQLQCKDVCIYVINDKN